MQNFDQNSIQEAMRLASTPAGQQLIQHLRQSGNANIQQAMNQAAAGDYAAAKTLIQQMLDNPEIKTLIEQLGR